MYSSLVSQKLDEQSDDDDFGYDGHSPFRNSNNSISARSLSRSKSPVDRSPIIEQEKQQHLSGAPVPTATDTNMTKLHHSPTIGIKRAYPFPQNENDQDDLKR